MVSSSSYYSAVAAGILLATATQSTSTSSTFLPGCHAFVPASTGIANRKAAVNRDVLKTGVPAPSPVAPNWQHIPTALHANPAAGRTPGSDPPQDISDTTQTALDKYGIDFTAKAAEGKLDPGTFACICGHCS